ncbi:hypothetical protein ACFPJ1_23160 [Kribbella qitaiheensis]|uniref:hypothetical protein n=1 Tax=Kribbella qitaiheensis TaxID=1544730 RepID=UPI00361246A8
MPESCLTGGVSAILNAVPGKSGNAQAAPAPATVVSEATAADTWEYVGDFFWQCDCHNAGKAGIDGGAWKKYKCINGSAFPGDDYELHVVY